jgi:hypothetical protein
MSKKNPPAKPLTKGEKKAQAQAQAREDAKRAENARKSARMGNAFLFAFLALLALFCLYTLVASLFFPAKSVPELRDNLILLSMVSVPYLIIVLAWGIWRLTRSRRAKLDSRTRGWAGLLFGAVILGALLLFGVQFARGRTEASQLPAYRAVTAALAEDGQAPEPLEEVLGFRTLLEYSQQNVLDCNGAAVRLNYHVGRFAAGRFRAQTARDYGALTAHSETRNGVELTWWSPAPGAESPKAALLASRGDAVLILEFLSGDEEHINALLTLAQAGAAEALAGD